MKILLMPGSLRKDSFNRKLVTAARDLLPSDGVSASLRGLEEFPLPVYDGDIEEAGLPSEVSALGDEVSRADCLIISSPEYNGSIAGPFKNAFDWVSRLDPMPWEEKPVLLMSASPGSLGGMRGLASTRVPFDAVGAFVYPTYFSLPKAHEAFEGMHLKDEKKAQRLKELLAEFIVWAKRLKK